MTKKRRNFDNEKSLSETLKEMRKKRVSIRELQEMDENLKHLKLREKIKQKSQEKAAKEDVHTVLDNIIRELESLDNKPKPKKGVWDKDIVTTVSIFDSLSFKGKIQVVHDYLDNFDTLTLKEIEFLNVVLKSYTSVAEKVQEHPRMSSLWVYNQKREKGGSPMVPKKGNPMVPKFRGNDPVGGGGGVQSAAADRTAAAVADAAAAVSALGSAIAGQVASALQPRSVLESPEPETALMRQSLDESYVLLDGDHWQLRALLHFLLPHHSASSALNLLRTGADYQHVLQSHFHYSDLDEFSRRKALWDEYQAILIVEQKWRARHGKQSPMPHSVTNPEKPKPQPAPEPEKPKTIREEAEMYLSNPKLRDTKPFSFSQPKKPFESEQFRLRKPFMWNKLVLQVLLPKGEFLVWTDVKPAWMYEIDLSVRGKEPKTERWMKGGPMTLEKVQVRKWFGKVILQIQYQRPARLSELCEGRSGPILEYMDMTVQHLRDFSLSASSHWDFKS